MTGAQQYEIPEELAGERADVGVSRLTGMSRSKAANLISDGVVTINSKAVGRSDRLAVGVILDIAEAEPDEAAEQSRQPVDGLEVIYLDDDIVVVTKPVGVAAHASPGWTGPTVTAGLPAIGISLADSGPEERKGIVHRLDVGTSGLMVLARTPLAYTSLKDQFKQREVTKTYHALVQGHPDPSTGTINAPTGRHPAHDYRFAVVADGKPSVTHYRTLEAFAYASLLEIGLETGRTHQIRVHMSALRHPCCGDMTYGADPVLAARLGLSRQWLHAVKLTITHPRTGERVTFESPYPADLEAALKVLGE
jgi:23S rRNA pseudouridine1911/1915/1917 synthase